MARLSTFVLLAVYYFAAGHFARMVFLKRRVSHLAAFRIAKVNSAASSLFADILTLKRFFIFAPTLQFSGCEPAVTSLFAKDFALWALSFVATSRAGMAAL